MPKKQLLILVCDDEEGIRSLLCQFLESVGHKAIAFARAEEAETYLSGSGNETRPDIVITDLRMPGKGGMAFLAWLQEQGPDIPAFVMSAYGEVKDAVQAMKHGAVDYLVKPFEPEELLLKIERAVVGHASAQELLRTKRPGFSDLGPVLTSKNPEMQAVLEMARRSAPSNASVLITGESGTGKEVLARAIHELSLRSSGPFVAVNLGGFPDNLLESELFGYERGAFTGADKRKLGLFELAHGGTLFLDEIGDMPLKLQVKILRVLQERRIQRLGGTNSIVIDIRIIAATNRKLDQAVSEGSFREDLLYRLNVIALKLPALRDRMEDLEPLAKSLLSKHDRSQQKHRISPEALAGLKTYNFPGNIRELENMIERALILSNETALDATDFGLSHRPHAGPKAVKTGEDRLAEDPPDVSQGLDAIEAWAIRGALERTGGKRERAADLLGISRRTLLNKLKRYDI